MILCKYKYSVKVPQPNKTTCPLSTVIFCLISPTLPLTWTHGWSPATQSGRSECPRPALSFNKPDSEYHLLHSELLNRYEICYSYIAHLINPLTFIIKCKGQANLIQDSHRVVELFYSDNRDPDRRLFLLLLKRRFMAKNIIYEVF